MYLASLINKGREVYLKGTTDPTALPAETILEMATINGAKSVLWDNEIGSLEIGKKVSIIPLLLRIVTVGEEKLGSAHTRNHFLVCFSMNFLYIYLMD